MKKTWFVVESEKSQILVMEIYPQQADGALKLFTVDGEGYLWMPHVNPPAEMTDARKPERFGQLLAVTQGTPPVSLLREISQGKEVVIIPAR